MDKLHNLHNFYFYLWYIGLHSGRYSLIYLIDAQPVNSGFVLSRFCELCLLKCFAVEQILEF